MDSLFNRDFKHGGAHFPGYIKAPTYTPAEVRRKEREAFNLAAEWAQEDLLASEPVQTRRT
jgi:hypothetical protein